MISDQTYDFEDVAHEIMQDQVMSAKVIRFCNSVFCGVRARVDSIEERFSLSVKNGCDS